ncbi:hypothetical protein JAO73_17810 [Hymenobacter sp. BT523]|uniref:hypothetical protein n=1 Tax=Hymenobacter sp. BT523 TaxID=2795725 RepID=UPI0018EC0FD7|nr:hypothetical protein [Hymenobacter sp. BT523]MBJ6110884.1 hypothetical protein [Hymenobacter sp. BT523]
MKILPLALALGLSTAAFAQTTPASNVPASNDSNPLAPSNNQSRVNTAVDGSNIANNRDKLSPGTGTPVAPRSDAEKKAHRDAKRAAKGKSKSKM